MVKNLPANPGDIRDVGTILGLRRSPGGGRSNPLQYSCLENSYGQRAWCATVHSVAKSWIGLKRLRVLAHSKNTLKRSLVKDFLI